MIHTGVLKYDMNKIMYYLVHDSNQGYSVKFPEPSDISKENCCPLANLVQASPYTIFLFQNNDTLHSSHLNNYNSRQFYFFLLFFTFFLSSFASSSLSYCGDVGEYDGEVGE